MALNLQVNLGGLVMPNPVTDASGTFAAGASHIVVGRPITQAEDPAAAFDAIAAEL